MAKLHKELSDTRDKLRKEQEHTFNVKRALESGAAGPHGHADTCGALALAPDVHGVHCAQTHRSLLASWTLRAHCHACALVGCTCTEREQGVRLAQDLNVLSNRQVALFQELTSAKGALAAGLRNTARMGASATSGLGVRQPAAPSMCGASPAVALVSHQAALL